MVLSPGIVSAFAVAKRKYDSGENPYDEIKQVGELCLKEIKNHSGSKIQGHCGSTEYIVFDAGGKYSRPIRPDLFLINGNFASKWDLTIETLKKGKYMTSSEQADCDKAVYTLVSAFSTVYNLWKTASRKTPGTFFEIVVGTLLSTFYTECARSKFIPIPGEHERVTTDIVLISKTTKRGLVVPTKITTRERIVQPFVHQRILESVFGDKYKSLLVCVSEMQRQEDKGVNQICVPGTIKLFNKHVAKLSGLVYLDPPERYLMKDITSIMPVMNFGSLFTKSVGDIIR
jgi:hypothetical protein